jgi:hypothetical protein
MVISHAVVQTPVSLRLEIGKGVNKVQRRDKAKPSTKNAVPGALGLVMSFVLVYMGLCQLEERSVPNIPSPGHVLGRLARIASSSSRLSAGFWKNADAPA